MHRLGLLAVLAFLVALGGTVQAGQKKALSPEARKVVEASCAKQGSSTPQRAAVKDSAQKK